MKSNDIQHRPWWPDGKPIVLDSSNLSFLPPNMRKILLSLCDVDRFEFVKSRHFEIYLKLGGRFLSTDWLNYIYIGIILKIKLFKSLFQIFGFKLVDYFFNLT